MTTHFESLFARLAQSASDDYEEARKHARDKDPQQGGHVGESTWGRLLSDWGPGWPVVTRKYVVGPGGSTNEIDVLVLKPGYPVRLHDEPSVLVSGVAAAFSSKTTLRKGHILEAIGQKKRLLEVAQRPEGSVREILCGPVPFGLLCHSTSVQENAGDFAGAMQILYEEVAHAGPSAAVSHPREELDALLVADRAFLSTWRLSWAPVARSPESSWGPSTTMNRYAKDAEHPGAPLAQFVTWLHKQCSPDGAHPLAALEKTFGADASHGYQTTWPTSIYPQRFLEKPSSLLNQSGNPQVF